jgi:glutathione S-transferase
MKLYFSSTSPYVRKCLVVAHELGLYDRIERLPSNAHPVNRDHALMAANPLGQVPTLLTDDGQALYDSRVICEYLNLLAQGSLFPQEGPQRWAALTQQALADGMLAGCLLARYEDAVRPEPLRWAQWRAGQLDKAATGLRWMEQHVSEFEVHWHIGTIALACALGYLDFRFAGWDWRAQAPRVAAWFARAGGRPSFAATLPPG